MSRIRVCYISRYAEGGSAISLKTLVCHLDRDQFEPVVVFREVRSQEVVRDLTAAGIEVHTLCDREDSPSRANPPDAPCEIRHRTPRLLRDGACRPLYLAARALRDSFRRDARDGRAALKRFLHANKVDILHFNSGLKHAWPELLATRDLPVGRVCHVRNFAELSTFERLGARHLDRLIYISKAIEEDQQRQGIPPEKGRIIHNVTTLLPGLPPQRRAEILSEFGWDSDAFVVANVGRLVAWKGQDTFLRAVHSLVPALPRLRCLIVGEPDDVPRSHAFAVKLRQMAASWKLEDRVIFTGHRADAGELMSAADVVVHSAATPEPFGRVIIEAMAAGTAVVAARAGGVLDIVDDGINGLLAEPGDESSYAAAIERLAAAPQLCRGIAAAGRLQVQTRFSVEAHVRRVQELYLQVLKTTVPQPEPEPVP